MKRIVDRFLLVGSALIVCIVGGAAFFLAEAHNINPLWVIVSFIAVGFIAGAREDYRREFRSVRFVAFVCGWAVVNVIIFIVVLGLWGWLFLIPALFLEQVLFYMTAYWLFGLPPPSRRKA